MSVASAPCPVVVLDADGHIAELNDAAGALLPAARLGQPLSSPAWLAAADRTRPVPVSGEVADRSFSARPSVLAAGTPVMAGGLAFGADGRYARLLGADAGGAGDRLAAGPPARPGPAHQAIDGLPHRGDQEYTLVARSSTRLVRDTFQRLERHIPALRAYSDEQRERTAEDIAHIVGFLTAALYVDADDVFTGFLVWTTEVLTARRVPARSLPPCLDLLEEQLHDFPRARRIPDAGRTALASCPCPRDAGRTRDRRSGPPGTEEGAAATGAGRAAVGRPGGPRPAGA
ncbi:hypothetical protein [Streptomyces qaidamensis]|uniref:hypothetical protein n=1 Tax=Streptomyces qaidamensis TaxID=1783515 RepID=UPI00157CC8E9